MRHLSTIILLLLISVAAFAQEPTRGEVRGSVTAGQASPLGYSGPLIIGDGGVRVRLFDRLILDVEAGGGRAQKSSSGDGTRYAGDAALLFAITDKLRVGGGAAISTLKFTPNGEQVNKTAFYPLVQGEYDLNDSVTIRGRFHLEDKLTYNRGSGGELEIIYKKPFNDKIGFFSAIKAGVLHYIDDRNDPKYGGYQDARLGAYFRF